MAHLTIRLNEPGEARRPVEEVMLARSTTGWILVGYGVMHVALDVTAHLVEGLGPGLMMLLAGSAGLVAAMLVVILVHRCRTLRSALRALGFGRPVAVTLGVSAITGTFLILCMPLVFSLAGAELMLPTNWLVLALGIVLLNGIAEETIYRGYLFGRLRELRTFATAALLGIALHALAHVPLVATGGITVGVSGIVVAAVGFPAMAYLYERGSNTIWAPAMLHAVANLIILPLSASGASPTGATLTAAFGWLGLSITCTYLAVIFVHLSLARTSATRGGRQHRFKGNVGYRAWRWRT